MVRKFGWLCLTALALCLALGCASAQTRQAVCEELGACDYADFADWEVETWVNGEEKPCGPLPEAFDSKTGMTLWQLPMGEYRGGSYVARDLLQGWFASEGMLSQANFDLDGDGQDEWLVLHVRSSEPDEYGDSYHELYLRIYEVTGEELELAEEICMDRSLDYLERMCIDVLRVEGQTLLAYQALNRVDSPWANLWLLAYADGKLSVRAGFERDSTGDGYDGLCVHGSDTDAHEFADFDFSAPHGEDGGSAVADEVADWEHYREHYREALDALPAAAELLEKVFQPMGGTSILADDPRHYELAGVALTLLDMDAQAVAPGDEPVVAIRFRGAEAAVRTTASVNLRSEPSLDGAKLGAVPEGTWLPGLGEIRTDDRGVDWYKVSFEGADAWISSRYSERR